MAKKILQIDEDNMFKLKKNQTPVQPKREWELMTIPKEKDANKYQRSLRYIEVSNGTKMFVEKLHNYDLYIISNGTNPGNVKVISFAENLESAMILAKNHAFEIKESSVQ
jgi:hypothetical protein